MLIDFDHMDVNLSGFDHIMSDNTNDARTEFFAQPGDGHYHLLAYLSTLFNDSTIVDIGTHRGSSALALSYNMTNKIVSFDIVNNVTNDGIKNKHNILFVTDNVFNNLNAYKHLLLSSPMIFLDIDPHEGQLEYQLYLFLKQNNYQGLLVCDDIWHFQGMRNNFWYLVEDQYKHDVTEVGHWSGTGIITFNADYIFKTYHQSGWTLVTAYFNLAKCPDASDEIRARDQAYYVKHAHSTLSLPNNLVIFCDAESQPLLEAIRPAYLTSKTKYIVCEFDNFVIDNQTFTTLRQRIIEARIKQPYRFDPRNTGSYYLF